MKRIVIVAALVVMGFSVAAAHPHGAGAYGSLGMFYSSLGMHGEWIFVGGDVYAWRPHRVGGGWRPYWDGRWVWTDDGWYWVSDEPWAWAVYHYGRWFYDDYYGWIWIPGYEWAPAWVEWRYGPDYVGWAPLGPYAVFSVAVGLHYSVSWMTPHSYWAFVPCHAMLHERVYRYTYPLAHNTRWIGASRGAGSVVYERGRVRTEGPERTFVERQGNLRVRGAALVDVDRRGGERVRREDGRERIEVYRPRIEREERDAVRARPERFLNSERTMNLSTARLDGRYRVDAAERHRVNEDLLRVNRPQESARKPEADVRRQDDARRQEEVRASRLAQGHAVTPARPDRSRLEKPRRENLPEGSGAQPAPREPRRRER